MCGIVGYIGQKEACPILLKGLKLLEYRGYDSAGIAIHNGSHTDVVRAEGKLKNLVTKIDKLKVCGSVGIGHTRWATHGKPSEKNAHPHRVGSTIIVHNGIIENYEELKLLLPKKGKELKSETDTEVVAHLIELNRSSEANFLKAFRKTIAQLEGTYAILALDEKDPQVLYVAKKDSPIVIGLGEKENFVASDVPALLPFTRNVIFLENGDISVIEKNKVTFYDKNSKKVTKKVKKITWTAEMAEKGGYKHFMLKEIMEQPRAIKDTLLGRVKKGSQDIHLEEIEKLFVNRKVSFFNRVYIVACGTSWHAALAGKYLLEAMAKIPVSVDTASEFRYREPFIDEKTLLIVISQSGETADTLACVQDAKSKGSKVISICNVVDSSIPRYCDANLYTAAGPEIGVASTKAFTTQLVVLLMLALYLGRKNGKLIPLYTTHAVKALRSIPSVMEKMLEKSEEMLRLAEFYCARRDFYYIARGIHYPIALEGALKLKEISYIHAEGYSAGEMKHGPIALIEPGTPVVALAPKDRVCSKMISNIEEVKARGADVIALVTQGDKRFYGKSDHVITLPSTEWYITPIIASLPLQLLAYYIADLKGADVDQPRNLAKSVTVE